MDLGTFVFLTIPSSEFDTRQTGRRRRRLYGNYYANKRETEHSRNTTYQLSFLRLRQMAQWHLLLLLENGLFIRAHFYDDCPLSGGNDYGRDDLCFFSLVITIVLLFIKITVLMAAWCGHLFRYFPPKCRGQSDYRRGRSVILLCALKADIALVYPLTWFDGFYSLYTLKIEIFYHLYKHIKL